MSKQLPKLFVDVEDVITFHNKSKSWAYHRMKDIGHHYKLEAHQRITIYQFCEYEGIPEEKLVKVLNAD